MCKWLPLTFMTAVVLIPAACSQPTSKNQNQAVNREQPAAVTAPTAAPETGFVYTANEGENSISAIDLSTGQVKTIPIRITPHNVQVSRDGSLLLVVGAVAAETGGHSDSQANGAGEGHGGEHGTGRGRLLIFDAAKMNAEDAVDIEVGRDPAHVIADPQGKLALCSQRGCRNSFRR